MYLLFYLWYDFVWKCQETLLQRNNVSGLPDLIFVAFYPEFLGL